jgi:hypothetical protein
MKDGKPNPSRTVYHEQFINTLTNLCWWWDWHLNNWHTHHPQVIKLAL